MTDTSDKRPEWFWELTLAVNAAFKGLLGSEGQSGHICGRTIALAVELPAEEGWTAVSFKIANALKDVVHDGDVVVIAEKPVAAALGRIGPREVILAPDPKTLPPDALNELAERWKQNLGFDIKPIHLLLADEYGEDQATLGVDDHNLRCTEMAAIIRRELGVNVDVIISDTDTGLDTRSPLIGLVTIGATPLGATAGVNLYEAMRCAVAAEFTRGHNRRIPVVVCVPADRRRHRPMMGRARPYQGTLDARQEPHIAHA